MKAWLCGDRTPRDWRNLRRVLWAMAAWAVVFAGGSQLIKQELLPAGAVSWLVAALSSVSAIYVLIAYSRFLREADELNRKIQLQALALGFGGGWLAVAGYRVFERLGAPMLDRSAVIVVMAVLYSIGVVLARLRYR